MKSIVIALIVMLAFVLAGYNGATHFSSENTIVLGEKLHIGDLRIATTGVGSVGCEFAVLAGAVTDYAKMQELSAKLSELSLPRHQENGTFETGRFEFSGEMPKEIRLFCAAKTGEPVEVPTADGVFALPEDIGRYYYFAYFTWGDNVVETVFFQANAFIFGIPPDPANTAADTEYAYDRISK